DRQEPVEKFASNRAHKNGLASSCKAGPEGARGGVGGQATEGGPVITIRSEAGIDGVPAEHRAAIAARWRSTQRGFVETGFLYEPDRDGPFYYSDGDGA